ncbi:MAG: 4Fe-4S ferredoxin [Proteobacteria bacterium]|nr:4Fe-4S ferredoxin [Pseudomonadota bacterium]
MEMNIYRELQERLDSYSLGFPATESGVELKILEKLFSEKDAEMFLNLSQAIESVEDIAVRLDLSPADVSEHLSDMARRGLLFHLRKGSSIKYGAIPFVHGLLEFQVKRMDGEMAGLVEKFKNEAFTANMAAGLPAFIRAVPVHQSIDVSLNIAPYEDAVEILKKQKRIVVTDCICRRQQKLVEKGCEKPMEVCFMFGSMGRYYLDQDLGREVELDEAIKILVKAQEGGLVTQPATTRNPGGMCNCCGDCCGVFKSLKNHPRPADIVYSNYLAVVDRDSCSACEICLERCQMDAIQVDDSAAEIDSERCIGCGLCVADCSTESMRLTLKPEDQRKIPPADTLEQMKLMARLRDLD